MVRKRQKEKEFLDKSKKNLKLITIIATIILTIIYCIDGGFYSLLFDLKESKTVIIYSVVIIILLVLLILFNICLLSSRVKILDKNITTSLVYFKRSSKISL